ncbi:MAG: 30S ribosomal protein S11 [Candidatus Doudnabacteria bacterium]|nr:30S ribosomal protein S11 [Candidatus Doudnabacteria bacterium]MCA9387594.1 30S ribosomal protein S11 [Candidatus Andersenbacteria bacterium]
MSTSETTSKKEAGAAGKKPVARKSSKRKLTRGRVYISSTYNNTLITVTDVNGNAIAWSSSGVMGFSGPKRATPYAATQVVRDVVEKVRPTGLRQVDVFVKGIGSGREAAVRALITNGLKLSSITDVTPVPHNGCRPPKPRRV